MKKNIFILTFLLNLVPPMSSAQTWEKVYTNVKPSIPLILSSGGLCAGALIEPDLIITAAHCVSRFRPIYVSWSEKTTHYESATIVGLNKKTDLALIKLTTPSTRKPIPLLDRSVKLKEGSHIATIGHPSIGEAFSNPPFDVEMTYLISSGIISGQTKGDFISDMSVSPGNSGGPVFNEQGELIGVVSRKRVDRFVGAIGFSASLESVYELLDSYHKNKEQRFTWKEASTSSKIYLAYTSHSFLENYKDSNLWHFGLVFDVWDRLRIELADNFSQTRGFQDYSLGYKFAYDLENHNLIYITPSVDFLHYQIALDDNSEINRRTTGYGLSLMMSSLALGLKYIGFEIDGKYQSVFAFQLGF